MSSLPFGFAHRRPHRITTTTLLLLSLAPDTLVPDPATPTNAPTTTTAPAAERSCTLSTSNAPPNANTHSNVNTDSNVNNAPSDPYPQRCRTQVEQAQAKPSSLSSAPSSSRNSRPSNTSHATSVAPSTPGAFFPVERPPDPERIKEVCRPSHRAWCGAWNAPRHSWAP